jgi:WD40 repeat protein
MKWPCGVKLTALAVTAGEEFLVGGTAEGGLYVWDLSSGDLLRQLEAHYKSVTVLRFTPTDQYLVSGSDDALVMVWSLDRYTLYIIKYSFYRIDATLYMISLSTAFSVYCACAIDST